MQLSQRQAFLGTTRQNRSSGLVPSCHLKKSIWHHNSVEDRPITTIFGRQMQSDMPMTSRTTKSKPKIEFQYGGHPFSETGSSYISAVDWVTSLNFGMQIHFDLLKRIPSLNLNPEVQFRVYDRHLEKSIWRHISADDSPITTKFDRQMQNDMPMIMHRSKSKPQIKFQYGPSFITRIKRQKFTFINSGPVDIIRSVYYIHGPELMKLCFFLPFYMCYKRWALHVVMKRKFFYIYI